MSMWGTPEEAGALVDAVPIRDAPAANLKDDIEHSHADGCLGLGGKDDLVPMRLCRISAPDIISEEAMSSLACSREQKEVG